MPHRVLIVACHEESREQAFLLSRFLESCGYSTENTHVDTEGESKIKIDRLLENGISVSDFLGVVFFDDGGNEEISVDLAKKVLKADKVLGGFSALGCAILHEAGALKKAYVCAGLPEEFYKDAKGKVESPSVRSDKIITGLGDCATGFGVVLVDALGGKVKRIIKSKDEDDVKVTVQPDDSKVKVIMARGSDGWKVVTASPSMNETMYKAVREVAHHAVILAQSELEDPNRMSQAVVELAFGDEGPVVERLETDEPERSGEVRRKVQLERELAREGVFMQPDGKIYMRGNPKGKSMSHDEAIEELMRLELEALEDEIKEGESPDKWSSLCSRRHRHVMRCLLAMLEMMGVKVSYKFASVGGPFLGSTSIGGPNFGTAVSDMDWRARVWPASEDEEWMKDREKFIEDLPRYNPEYVDQSQNDKNAYGVYYVWPEKNRGPIPWAGSIKEMKDKSPYKINDALKP